MKSWFRGRGKSTTDLSEWNRNDDKLLKAVQNGDKVKVNTLMTKKTLVPTKPGPHGLSVYHLAAAKGHLSILELFLTYGIDINCTDILGHTALHLAAKNGWPDIVDKLLKAGASHMALDGSRMTALHHACLSVQYPCVEILLKNGANVNMKDKIQKLDIINVASRNRKKQKIHQITGRTPLFNCAQTGDGAMCQLLLEQGAQPNVQDTVGRTPLMFAAIQGHADVSEHLLMKGANAQVVDQEGNTAMSYAKNANAKNVIDVINRTPAKLNWQIVDNQKKTNERPIDVVAEVTKTPSPAAPPPSSKPPSATLPRQPINVSDSESSVSTDVSGIQSSTMPRNAMFKPRSHRTKGKKGALSALTMSDPSLRTSLANSESPDPNRSAGSPFPGVHTRGTESDDPARTPIPSSSSAGSSPISSPTPERKHSDTQKIELQRDNEALTNELRNIRVDNLKLQDKISYLQQNGPDVSRPGTKVHFLDTPEEEEKSTENVVDMSSLSEQLQEYKEKLHKEEMKCLGLSRRLNDMSTTKPRKMRRRHTEGGPSVSEDDSDDDDDDDAGDDDNLFTNKGNDDKLTIGNLKGQILALREENDSLKTKSHVITAHFLKDEHDMNEFRAANPDLLSEIEALELELSNQNTTINEDVTAGLDDQTVSNLTSEQIAALLKENGHLKNCCQSLQDSCDQSKANYDSLVEAGDKLQSDYDQLRSDRDELEKEYQDIMREKSELVKENKFLVSDSNNLHDDLENLVFEMEKLQGEFKKQQELLSPSAKSQTAEITTLTEEKATLKLNCTELEEHVAKQSSDYTIVIEEVQSLQERLSSLEMERGQLQQEIELTQEDSEKLSQQNTLLLGEYTSLERDYAELLAEKERLGRTQSNASLQSNTVEHEQLLQRNLELSSQKEELQSNVDNITQENRRLNDQIHSLMLNNAVKTSVKHLDSSSNEESENEVPGNNRRRELALQARIDELEQEIQEFEERHKEVVGTYRMHLISAVQGHMDPEVKEALQQIIELRSMEQFC